MSDLNDSKTDELLTMLEDLQDENENLQNQISEAQRMISQLSSENFVLKSELQKKSAIIVSLNERIEKLNGSDIVLQQNEQLARQNRELQQSMQRTKEEAATLVSTVKWEYAAKEQELDNQIHQAAQRERIARNMEANYKNKVTEEAEKITTKARKAAEQEYKEKSDKAERAYREKRDAVYGVTMGSLLYCFFVTILTACNSERVAKDFLAFSSFVWKIFSGTALLAIEACTATWKVRNMISYQILNVIVAMVLVVLVFALITGLIYGLIGFVIYKAAKFYYQEFGDLISGVVALVSMGILVWFSDELTWITWNLILVWLLLQGVYILIRMMLSGSKSSWY